MSNDLPKKAVVKKLLNTGLVCESKKQKSVSEKKILTDLGEMLDVLAVAYDLKQFSSVRFYTLWKKKIQERKCSSNK